MRKSYIILLLSICFLFSGCNKEYRKLSRKKSIKQPTYSLLDSIHLENYILYNTISHFSIIRDIKPMPIDTDSVMEIVGKSFYKFNIPIKYNFSIGNNNVDSAFYNIKVVNIKDINEDWIKEIAGDTKGRLTLVPFIYIFNSISFTGYITSGGMAGNNGFHLMTFLNLMVFIVKNDEIVYSSQALHTTERTWADTRAEAEALPPAPLVKQEHWDELVRLAMEDYIKRLK